MKSCRKPRSMRPNARGRRGAVALCLALLGAPAMLGEARADEQGAAAVDEAAKDFADGERAFKAGDFVGAATHFEAAFQKAPHYAPLWNAARAWHRAGSLARAATLYARYLRESPET